MSKPRRTDVLKLAGEASADPRTAEKWLREGDAAVKPMIADRLREAQQRIQEREARRVG
jgi:hypothetical protein